MVWSITSIKVGPEYRLKTTIENEDVAMQWIVEHAPVGGRSDRMDAHRIDASGVERATKH